MLLDSVSPYGSRRVVVEYDGNATSAYLHDKAGPVAATWIANHLAAPQSVDVARLRAGHAPEMPAQHTKYPDGSPQIDASTLTALWLEEGDGVAILQAGEPLAVLPGWSDLSKGMPGYSRDVVGQTPFAWSLDDALEGLGPRLRRAEQFWRWRASKEAWATFQQAMLGHLLSRLGPGGGYWDVSGGKQPLIGVSERPPVPQRRFTVLSTVGMSCQRMPVVEQTGESAIGRAKSPRRWPSRTMPSAQAARIFLWLAQYPWREVTWVGPGHSIPWYHEVGHVPARRRRQRGGAAARRPDAAARPRRAAAGRVHGCGDEPVRWLWVVPITERERRIAAERGSGSLVNQLTAQRRSWVYTPKERQ